MYDWVRELSISDWPLIRDYGQWAELCIVLALASVTFGEVWCGLINVAQQCFGNVEL